MKYRIFYVLFAGLSFISLSAQNSTLELDRLTTIAIQKDSIKGSFSYYVPKELQKGSRDVLIIHTAPEDSEVVMREFVPLAVQHNLVLLGNHNYRKELSFLQQVSLYNEAIRAFKDIDPIKVQHLYFVGVGAACEFAYNMMFNVSKLDGVLWLEPGAIKGQNAALKNKNTKLVVASSDSNMYSYAALVLQSNLPLPKNSLSFYWYPDSETYPKTAYMNYFLDAIRAPVSRESNRLKDSLELQRRLNNHLAYVNSLKENKRFVEALEGTELLREQFKTFKGKDFYKEQLKVYKKSKELKQAIKQYLTAQSKSVLLLEDYAYYFDEDMYRYNFENLGWWNYQMTELLKFEQGKDLYLKRMAILLRGELLFKIDEQISMVEMRSPLDDKLLDLLLMLKTIVYPNSYEAYLRIISLSSKRMDYGTALFYVEELLKNGFKNYQKLYTIPETTFLKLSPEYNDLIRKYLGKSRY